MINACCFPSKHLNYTPANAKNTTPTAVFGPRQQLGKSRSWITRHLQPTREPHMQRKPDSRKLCLFMEFSTPGHGATTYTSLTDCDKHNNTSADAVPPMRLRYSEALVAIRQPSTLQAPAPAYLITAFRSLAADLHFLTSGLQAVDSCKFKFQC